MRKKNTKEMRQQKVKTYSLLNYNSDIKIAGNIITIKAYSDLQQHQYIVSPSVSSKEKITEILEEEKKERFIKSCRRAKQKVFDLVICNTNKHLDYHRKKQTTKFLTLTFKDNITDLTIANQEFTKFLKRLSYFNYNIRKNVIKYIAVPELQKRGVWHFHIVIFNMKYTAFEDLKKIWGLGGVYINALQKSFNETAVAKYITKYISKSLKLDNKKAIEYNYKLYRERNMQNKKRYNCSRGLIQPIVRKVEITSAELTAVCSFLIDNANEEKGAKKVYYKEYFNEFRGHIQILCVELKKEYIGDLKQYLGYVFKFNINTYSKHQKINWEKLKNIREKQRRDLFEYDLERRYEWEYGIYQQYKRRWGKDDREHEKEVAI